MQRKLAETWVNLLFLLAVTGVFVDQKPAANGLAISEKQGADVGLNAYTVDQ